MVDEESIRKKIAKLTETLEEKKLDKMLTILHTAIDVSDKIDEIN